MTYTKGLACSAAADESIARIMMTQALTERLKSEVRRMKAIIHASRLFDRFVEVWLILLDSPGRRGRNLRTRRGRSYEGLKAIMSSSSKMLWSVEAYARARD